VIGIAFTMTTAAAFKLVTSPPPQVHEGVTPDIKFKFVGDGGPTQAGYLKSWETASVTMGDCRACAKKVVDSRNNDTVASWAAMHAEPEQMPESSGSSDNAETNVDGKVSVGSAREQAAVLELAKRLPLIFDGIEAEQSTTSLWGVSLAKDTPERRSLLATFLRAREWAVDTIERPEGGAEEFLRETLIWRTENRVSSAGEPNADFPEDELHTIDGLGPDGQPRTFVVIRPGLLSKTALQRLDEFVAWRIRQQVPAFAHTPLLLPPPLPPPLLPCLRGTVNGDTTDGFLLSSLGASCVCSGARLRAS
jgi:hypothetical protein